jgi:hypothetical protein
VGVPPCGGEGVEVRYFGGVDGVSGGSTGSLVMAVGGNSGDMSGKTGHRTGFSHACEEAGWRRHGYIVVVWWNW